MDLLVEWTNGFTFSKVSQLDVITLFGPYKQIKILTTAWGLIWVTSDKFLMISWYGNDVILFGFLNRYRA